MLKHPLSSPPDVFHSFYFTPFFFFLFLYSLYTFASFPFLVSAFRSPVFGSTIEIQTDPLRAPLTLFFSRFFFFTFVHNDRRAQCPSSRCTGTRCSGSRRSRSCSRRRALARGSPRCGPKSRKGAGLHWSYNPATDVFGTSSYFARLAIPSRSTGFERVGPIFRKFLTLCNWLR